MAASAPVAQILGLKPRRRGGNYRLPGEGSPTPPRTYRRVRRGRRLRGRRHARRHPPALQHRAHPALPNPGSPPGAAPPTDGAAARQPGTPTRARRLRAGMPIDDIARKHHISAASVGNIALKAGLTRGRRYTGDELVEMIVAWFVGDDIGESERDAITKVGVHLGTAGVALAGRRRPGDRRTGTASAGRGARRAVNDPIQLLLRLCRDVITRGPRASGRTRPRASDRRVGRSGSAAVMSVSRSLIRMGSTTLSGLLRPP